MPDRENIISNLCSGESDDSLKWLCLPRWVVPYTRNFAPSLPSDLQTTMASSIVRFDSSSSQTSSPFWLIHACDSGNTCIAFYKFHFNYLILETIASQTCFDETALSGSIIGNQHHQSRASMNPLTQPSLVTMHRRQQRWPSPELKTETALIWATAAVFRGVTQPKAARKIHSLCLRRPIQSTISIGESDDSIAFVS